MWLRDWETIRRKIKQEILRVVTEIRRRWGEMKQEEFGDGVDIEGPFWNWESVRDKTRILSDGAEIERVVRQILGQRKQQEYNI